MDRWYLIPEGIINNDYLPKCGTVTVTWLFVPTSTVAILLTSTDAGLKSSENYECNTGLNNNNMYVSK